MARATSPRALSLDSPACSTRTLTSTFFLLLLPTLPALQLPAPRPSARPTTGTLILVRHGQTVWDRNAFVGWADPDLGFTGEQQAFDVARALRESGYTFDVAYTSLLKRVIGPTRPLPFPPTPSTLPLPPPTLKDRTVSSLWEGDNFVFHRAENPSNPDSEAESDGEE